MFRIRRLHDATLPINRHVIAQIQDIIREQFQDVADFKIRSIPEMLDNPMKYDFRSVLFVCDDRRGKVKGFAQFSAEPSLGFGFLDLIALPNASKGGGLGAALYERVREECLSLGLKWLLFESLTDLPQYNPDPMLLKANRARLRFYERMGARPVLGTLCERPRKANADNAYFLLADDLDSEAPLDATFARAAMQAILTRKYRKRMPARDIEEVVASFVDDPVRLRPYRYIKERAPNPHRGIPSDLKIDLVVADRHDMHHITDHGYAELPVRVSSILEELEQTELFERVPRRHFGDKHILAVHDARFVSYFRDVAMTIDPDKSLFPDVFPIRKNVGQPRKVASHAGYYCIDVYSPINRNAYLAARDAVDAALTAARTIETGSDIAYALVRPPGHHAGKDSFGGYCYFNSTAIAAHHLTSIGRVAILDLDYHHGNGQQEIFYDRSDVLTVSIHGDPAVEYPYFSGYKEEIGEGDGEGYNLNIPLKRSIGGDVYAKALARAMQRIKAYKPEVLVVALGLDTAQNDPSGTWQLVADDFAANGRAVGALGCRTLVVQEGGYDCAVLGRNALAFLSGLWTAYHRK
ncbi:MAG: histone deacetylase family protein [Gammaproteobacteria bacterium]|nr:histone deacetylase family protein [Gammaproteobacteria bacterium]MCP5136323.1 histone deacetylase family protein [Gammaproteobacteria bacterium]